VLLRRAVPGPEPLLSPAWIETLGELMLSIRDDEPPFNETARDWANGVLTLLDDLRRAARLSVPNAKEPR
jgi:hypothetical protein